VAFRRVRDTDFSWSFPLACIDPRGHRQRQRRSWDRSANENSPASALPCSRRRMPFQQEPGSSEADERGGNLLPIDCQVAFCVRLCGIILTATLLVFGCTVASAGEQTPNLKMLVVQRGMPGLAPYGPLRGYRSSAQYAKGLGYQGKEAAAKSESFRKVGFVAAEQQYLCLANAPDRSCRPAAGLSVTYFQTFMGAKRFINSEYSQFIQEYSQKVDVSAGFSVHKFNSGVPGSRSLVATQSGGSSSAIIDAAVGRCGVSALITITGSKTSDGLSKLEATVKAVDMQDRGTCGSG
jgi:hypothetical protein